MAYVCSGHGVLKFCSFCYLTHKKIGSLQTLFFPANGFQYLFSVYEKIYVCEKKCMYSPLRKNIFLCVEV